MDIQKRKHSNSSSTDYVMVGVVVSDPEAFELLTFCQGYMLHVQVGGDFFFLYRKAI